MKKRLIKAIKGECGQALPTVLILLALGGMLIVPCLDYAATSLNSGKIVEKNVNGLYAADTGVEHALWKLNNSPPASYPYSYVLPETVNGLSVNVLIEQVTTLWGIVVGGSGGHADWMVVEGSMVYNEGLGVYIYTITITNQDNSNIKLKEIMVRLPPDFEYIAETTSSDFTTFDPTTYDSILQITGDLDTGMVLDWVFPSPRPNIPGAPDPNHGIYTVVTQTFQLNGPLGYSGDDDYVWVVAERSDIGCVGEANAYKITAQAKDGGTVVMTVRAGALKDVGMNVLSVSCWEINP